MKLKLFSLFMTAVTLFSIVSMPAQAFATVSLGVVTVNMCVNTKETLKIQKNNKKTEWKSSNTTVAKVSSKGVVTAKKVGKATITAKAGSTKYTVKIVVKKHGFKTYKSKGYNKCTNCGLISPISGTYAGIKINDVNDIVKLYNKAYNNTKKGTKKYKKDSKTVTYYSMLGEENLEVSSVLVDGKKDNVTINRLVPSIIAGLYSPSPSALPPATNLKPSKDIDKNKVSLQKSRLTASDLNYATVTEKNGYIILKLKPQAVKNSNPGMDAQGHLFTTFGNCKKYLKDIAVISYAKDSTTNVNYHGGSATVKIDPKTYKIVSADYVEKFDVKITHANVTVLKDKELKATVTYKLHFPASKSFLKECGIK